MQNKKCIVEIKNKKDQKCFSRAVAVAIAHRRLKDSPEAQNHYSYLRDGREPQQERDADEIMRNAGLDSHVGACGHKEWALVEQSLDSRYKLNIFAKEYCRGVLYEGREAKESLNLYLYDEHFAVITSLSAFMQRSYACPNCTVGYNNINEHVCLNTCRYCNHPGRCISDGQRIKCVDCGQWLPSQKCYDQHKSSYSRTNGERGKRIRLDAMCNTNKRCPKCTRIIRGKHECYKWECNACHQIVDKDADHQFKCYMQPIETKKNKEGEETKFEKSFIFFDFEASQDREYGRDKHDQPIYIHDVNFCVVHKVCDKCKASTDDRW